ncbi:3-keto-disaccharide hydrolase [Stieleria varia]|uniref:3-keto-alpha-glucoside-1,2-lyase/3-keto-2-hydroxy-glucal hydratase domain-containing protein n=1 Tax=Stieleria varia TaxID=2528005 RepID=A0A5C6A253_9BACT|nr:DUF1080 domain-containing protein [Stieleria varia]TWT93308.1 hypothetical protein Pla52n_59680 [Stieleria varia]
MPSLPHRILLGTALLFSIVLGPIAARAEDSKKSDSADSYPVGQWVSLFNGENLNGWTPKIRYEKFGDDAKQTFTVKDGLLVVGYENYDEFNETFGHLFFKDTFSHYRFRVEYRFVGDQCKGGPGWATRNSGVMIHGESPETMGKDQDFPASIEVQLLGGDGKAVRPTSNLCTPGTNVVYKDKLHLPHCTQSTSKTYHGEQWVTAEIEVRGNGVIKHILDGEVVLEYQKPQLDDRDTHAATLIEQSGGKMLSGGTISLQSESHPVQFRKVEIMVLAPESEATN